MLFLDGVYTPGAGSAKFRWVKASTSSELNQLTHTIARRLARYLERQGLLKKDIEHSTLTMDSLDEGPLDQLRGQCETCHYLPHRGGASDKAVKSLPCKHCLTNAMPMKPRGPRPETLLDFPVWLVRPVRGW